MSGGSFQYAYSHTRDFADKLADLLDDPHGKDRDGYEKSPFPPAVLAKLAEIQRLAELCAKLMKEAEWLYSCDTGDDTFMERVAEIEATERQGVIE